MVKIENREAKQNLNITLDDDESLTSEEAFAKVAMLLARTDKPKVLSELDDYEIRLCSALFAVAEKTKDLMLLSFLENFLLLRVSHRRQGRKELLEIAKSSREVPEQRFSRLRNILGMGSH